MEHLPQLQGLGLKKLMCAFDFCSRWRKTRGLVAHSDADQSRGEPDARVSGTFSEKPRPPCRGFSENVRPTSNRAKSCESRAIRKKGRRSRARCGRWRT